MDQRGKVIGTKIDECNTELAEIKKQMATAKGTRLKTLKQKALQILRRRKMYDGQQGHIMNQQFNVDQVAFANESMQDTINTVLTTATMTYLILLLSSLIGFCFERSKYGTERTNEELRHGPDGGSLRRYGRYDG